MPTLTQDGASATSYAPTIFTIPMEYHSLRSISVHDVSGQTIGNDIRIEAGILIGTPQQNTKISVLLAGLLGAGPGIGICCNIPVEPGMKAYCEVTGSSAATVRLSIILWKLVIDDEGMIRLDP